MIQVVKPAVIWQSNEIYSRQRFSVGKIAPGTFRHADELSSRNHSGRYRHEVKIRQCNKNRPVCVASQSEEDLALYR